MQIHFHIFGTADPFLYLRYYRSIFISLVQRIHFYIFGTADLFLYLRYSKSLFRPLVYRIHFHTVRTADPFLYLRYYRSIFTLLVLQIHFHILCIRMHLQCIIEHSMLRDHPEISIFLIAQNVYFPVTSWLKCWTVASIWIRGPVMPLRSLSV